MTKFLAKFENITLSKKQMKAVKGGECTNFGAFKDCLMTGQTYASCLAHCAYLE